MGIDSYAVPLVTQRTGSVVVLLTHLNFKILEGLEIYITSSNSELRIDNTFKISHGFGNNYNHAEKFLHIFIKDGFSSYFYSLAVDYERLNANKSINNIIRTHIQVLAWFQLIRNHSNGAIVRLLSTERGGLIKMIKQVKYNDYNMEV